MFQKTNSSQIPFKHHKVLRTESPGVTKMMEMGWVLIGFDAKYKNQHLNSDMDFDVKPVLLFRASADV